MARSTRRRGAFVHHSLFTIFHSQLAWKNRVGAEKPLGRACRQLSRQRQKNATSGSAHELLEPPFAETDPYAGVADLAARPCIELNLGVAEVFF